MISNEHSHETGGVSMISNEHSHDAGGSIYDKQ